MRHRIVLSLCLLLAAAATGCFTSSSTPDDGILAVNPRTAEMRRFASESDVPDGWEVCAMDACPSPHACSELDEPSCLAREDCTAVYAEGAPTDPDPYAGCVEGGAPSCDPSACGPAPGAPAYECPDGSIGGNTGRCLVGPDGMCGWEFRECPTACDCGPLPAIARICPDGSTGTPVCRDRTDGMCAWEHECGGGTTSCTPDECGPDPGAPSMVCADGTVAGPMCERNTATGVCGWIVTSCPEDPCDPATGMTCVECPADSCGPAPAIAAICPDGTTADMVCGPSSDTTMCDWRFVCPGGDGCDDTACGPPPGASPMCSDGSAAEAICAASADGMCGWAFQCPGGSGGGDGEGSTGCATPDGTPCADGLMCCSGVPYPPEGICHASCPAISDRDQKTGFTTIDPESVLERIVTMPVGEWSYRFEPNARHVGPMAQDFHARFGLGADERHIHPVDGVGVSLLAIQALHERVEGLADQNERLSDENAVLRDRLERLERGGR
jgi:hypothetical protein